VAETQPVPGSHFNHPFLPFEVAVCLIVHMFGLYFRLVEYRITAHVGDVFYANSNLKWGVLLCISLPIYAQVTPPTLTSDSQEFDTEKKELLAEGRVELSHADLFLETEQLTVNQRTFDVKAPGEVRISKEASLLLGREMRYNYRDRGYELSDLRFGHKPFYIEGEKLAGEPNRILIENATLYYGEPDIWGPSLTARSISIVNGNEVTANDAVIRIAGLPLLSIDAYTQSVESGGPLRLGSAVGYRKNLGAYARSRVGYRRNPGDVYGLNVDVYSKRGVLAGPVMEYRRIEDAGSYYAGALDTGFMHDTGDVSERGRDIWGKQIDRFRFYTEWQHRQEIHDSIDLVGKLSWWSDSEVTRDFRENLFDQNQQPDSFFEAVYRGERYLVSGFTRIQPNDFQDIAQRLPEVRLDWMPIEWFDTGIYGRASASAAQLIERDPSGTFAKRDTGRIHVYYGINRPTQLTSWLVAVPVAGVQLTHYTDPLTDRSDYTRLLGQVGMDLEARIHGVWNYKNDFWNIDGLRHILQPSVQYRYIPEAENGTNIIPKIDRLAGFDSYLLPIDLGDKRNIDDLHESSTVRLGLENLLQTRHPEYGSIDLLTVDLFQDYRFSARTGQNDFSDLYTYVTAQPAYWLKFHSFSRVDPEFLTLRELRTRLSVVDGEVWSLYVGNDYVKQTPFVDSFDRPALLQEINQYVVGATRRLNERNSVRGEVHVDTDLGQVTEQIYAWKTRVSNSWDIEFQIAHRNGTRREDDFQFNLLVELLTF